MSESPRGRTEQIRRFLIEAVEAHPEDLGRVAQAHFGISRQAVSKHLAKLVDEGILGAVGHTRARRYSLRALAWNSASLPVDSSLAEDLVWTSEILPHLEGLPKNVIDICAYGFTEMLNNVRDHSEASTAAVGVTRTVKTVKLWVMDTGVGIFRKIKRELGLADERQAIFELSKGKLTTDPERHTGEGVFFTSRMFDLFGIRSMDFTYSREGGYEFDFVYDSPLESKESTFILMELATDCTRTDREVFDKYTSSDRDLEFAKTVVVVHLAKQEGERLISRSQAKRVMARCDRFRQVLLDFDRIDWIGPAFADEIFRVFKNSHPEVEVSWRDAAPEVEAMILRALAHESSP